MDAPHGEEADERDDDQRAERHRKGEQEGQADQGDGVEAARGGVLLREGDEERNEEDVDDGGALGERLPPARQHEPQLRARRSVVEVEIEVGEERSDGDGHGRRKEDDHRHEKDERQKVAEDAEREERRGLLDLCNGAEQPGEEHEVPCQEEREDRRGNGDLDQRRRIEGAGFAQEESEGPEHLFETRKQKPETRNQKLEG